MTFVDTNVLLDVLGNDPVWRAWSLDQMGRLDDARASLIVVAELAPGFSALEEVMGRLQSFGVTVCELTDTAAFVAGKRFADYRRTQPQRTRVLADFIIGAQALEQGRTLLTRDIRIYRRYFPELTLIAPETEHD